MLTQAIWWTANLLLVTLLARLFITGAYRYYSALSAYLVFLFFYTIAAYTIYMFYPEYYVTFFWNTEFIGVVIEYFIIWEIYTRALEHFPGTHKLARAILMIAFVLILSRYVGITLLGGSGAAENIGILDRDFRALQAFLMAGILLIVGYYRIPIGRNLNGLILGYGFYVGVGVASAAIQDYFWNQWAVWSEHVQPLSFAVTLGIWVQTMWEYQPAPKPAPEIRIEQDYLRLAMRTSAAFSRARSFMMGALKS